MSTAIVTATRQSTLLSDSQVVNFIINGFHLIEPRIPEELNRAIATQLDSLDNNPGDAITETVPHLQQVVAHPSVDGVLVSLAGRDYEVMAHRHCKRPGTEYMHWHQDGKNTRAVGLNSFLGLYYPADVTADMGPTIIVPGTQYRNAPTDRMRAYTNILGQLPLVVPAGTFAVTHYDLWHGTAANRSTANRHMVKFLFRRVGGNESPTWRHDPSVRSGLRDWNERENSNRPVDRLFFSNPLNVSQTDRYKEVALRRQIWNELTGTELS